jgi:two-component system sensor histidine kinase KdpD
LHNAAKFSPAQSEIQILVEEEKENIKVSVIDQGVGIEPADEERIFEKFYRLQSSGNVSGTGLGLSICRGIIEVHGGKIGAKNNPGGGTIIHFTLPIDYTSPQSGEKKMEGDFIDSRSENTRY